MATILKVHGTFASGPEEGDKWWQRGSECCSHVGELVEAEDGNLKIEQVIWDGLNSERSRQEAAAKLLDRMGELEKAGEPYCVVGHSHGGSVISAALLRAAFYTKPLDKLSRWITIGTPFIEAKRSRLMLFRLGTVGRTLVLSIWTGFLGFIALNEILSSDKGLDPFVIAFVAVVLTLLTYPFLWLLARNLLPWHDKRTQERTRAAFAGRWLSLRHEDDEAVQGLGAFQFAKHPIFARDFAVASLRRLSFVLVPLMIALSIMLIARYNATAKTTIEQVASQAGVSQPAQSSKTEVAPGPAATAKAVQLPKTSAEPAAKAANQESGGERTGAIIAGLAFIIGGFMAVSMGAYYLISLMARPTSAALSYGFNRMTWSQLRSNGLGNDVDGEVALQARSRPTWIDADAPPLPTPLAGEIASVSDEAAAKSIAKFRAALSDLGFYRLQRDGRDALNAFLTGDELIHTTYFKIPRFRKLLAYSIAQSPGFRPSPALLADPDFPQIEHWYKELTAPAVPVATRNQPALSGAAVALQTS